MVAVSDRRGNARLPHPLHLWQAVQQANGVLRVRLLILAARCADPQRPGAHGLQHRLIEVFVDQRVGQLPQVVLQDSWKGGRRSRR